MTAIANPDSRSHSGQNLLSPSLFAQLIDRDPVKDDEHEAWLNLSIRGLGEAYGEDEPEYSTDLIKAVNPHYAGS
jgi:hypothetical protein